MAEMIALLRRPTTKGNLPLAAVVALLPLLGGCASFGIPEVDIDLGVSIEGASRSNQRWQSTPRDFSREPLFKRAHFKFDATVYSGELFAWRFFATTDSIGASVRGAGPEPICFRFDEARLKSSMQSREIPLRIKWSQRSGAPIHSDAKTDGRSYPAVQQCFGSVFTAFSFGPELIELFPNDAMFNIKLSDSGNTMVSNGKGQWLKLLVPVEHSGKREEVTITFVANDTSIRIGNFLR